MQSLGLEISLFLFAALLGYVLAVRIGQSVVIGEILIGILLGPSILGIIKYNELVGALAEIGAIFLLFVIGLECNFKEIYTIKNSFIALFGVIVPLVLGFFMTKFFGYSDIQSLFVGTALTATSIAITANVLKEMGKLNTETAKIIIGAAVVDDVLGLLILGVTVGLGTTGIALVPVIKKISIALGFLLGAIIAMPIVTYYMNKTDKWAKKIRYEQITLILAITIAFAYSAIAEIVGLSAIVGAFLAGVTLESLAIRSYKEGSKYLEMVFSAIFFVSLGILVNLKEMQSSWLFFISLVLIAIISKIIGCFIPALLTGIDLKNSLIIGVGMVPRGEFVMVVALVGLTNNIINQDIYASILLMALVTTVILPILLKYAYSYAERFK